ncbi:hypothetical protein Q5741_18690 [Paenibacillus sp. JX-17]|uniref:Phage head-tail adapter protein n=1 Tax=Paenibacillus lacisoli TaxID=3064525 RepID=A0ABT9CGP6_9BACL|nr:hypothetical protein [Paenibacillus sp. JX-17]MDO7908432.1 hypothetical protein [Paenibacillus sp. JX-17]
MNHRFKMPLVVYRVTSKEDSDDLFSDRKPSKTAELKCFVIKTETSEKTDEKPVLFILKKQLGVAKHADVQLGDEVSLLGRRYLVIDVVPRRYWTEIQITCEVKGSEHS